MAVGAMLGRLFGTPQVAVAAAAAESPGQSRLRLALPDPATDIAASIGQKVLHGWLQNRHQTRYPLVLNLRHQAPAETTLIVELVALALQSGNSSAQAATDAMAWLKSIGGDPSTVDKMADARPHPAALVRRVQEAGLAPQGYAACARALGRRTLANRRFLDFLSARLSIPDEMAKGINRRHAT